MNVMKEREFSQSYRLARSHDNPWEVAVVKGSKPLGNIPAGIRNPPLPLKLANGAGDMLSSLTKYISDFLRHRTPIKYLYLVTYAQKKTKRTEDITPDIDSRDPSHETSQVSALTNSIVSFLNTFTHFLSSVNNCLQV